MCKRAPRRAHQLLTFFSKVQSSHIVCFLLSRNIFVNAVTEIFFFTQKKNQQNPNQVNLYILDFSPVLLVLHQ